MKGFIHFLVGAAALFAPATSHALMTQVPYNAFIPNGPLAIPVGTWFIELDNDIPGVACRYSVEWDNNAVVPLSADCFIDEEKVHGAASCITNSITPVTTFISLDPHFPCSGFDRFQQFHPQVALLFLGEDGVTGNATGVIQFTPATTMVNSFEIVPIGVPVGAADASSAAGVSPEE